MVVDWGFSWSVVFTGLVVVFIVLILLVALCAIMGKVFQTLTKPKSNKPSASAPVVKPQGNSAVAEIVQDGISDEVVAAITAAISVVMSAEGVQKPFAVKSIKRAKNNSVNAWKNAGIHENTRSF